MNLEELQEAWKSQETRTTVGVVMLLESARAKHRRYNRILFWRNLREGWLTILAAVYFAIAVETDVSSKLRLWPFYLAMAIVFGIGVFRVVGTRRQQREDLRVGDPTTSYIEQSLGQINYRIWLLKNILWWWILPVSVAGVLIVAQIVLLGGLQDPALPLKLSQGVGIVALVLAAVYWGNLWTARKYWLPRKAELQAIFDSLRGS